MEPHFQAAIKAQKHGCAPKVSKGRSQTSFVFMPFGRARRRDSPRPIKIKQHFFFHYNTKQKRRLPHARTAIQRIPHHP